MSPMAATHHSQLNDAIFFPFSRFFSVGEAGGGCFSQHPIKGGQTEFISFRWDEETSVCRRTRRDEGESSEPVWSGPVPTSRYAIIYFLRSRRYSWTGWLAGRPRLDPGLQERAHSAHLRGTAPLIKSENTGSLLRFIELRCERFIPMPNVCLHENHSGLLSLPSGAGPVPTATLHICFSTRARVCGWVCLCVLSLSSTCPLTHSCFWEASAV